MFALTGAVHQGGQWILAPALPYFAMAKGCHAFHYAMISSAYAATQMLSSPLLGVLSDRIGRRPILLGGLAATSVVCLSHYGRKASTRPTTVFPRCGLNCKSSLQLCAPVVHLPVHSSVVRLGLVKLFVSQFLCLPTLDTICCASAHLSTKVLVYDFAGVRDCVCVSLGLLV